MLAMELNIYNNDPLQWNNFINALINAYKTVDYEMVAGNKLHNLKQKGFVEEYTNKFQHLYAQITKFVVSRENMIEHFLSRLNEDV